MRTTANTQDDSQTRSSESESIFDDPTALVVGFIIGGLMMAIVAPGLFSREDEDES